MDNTRRKFIKQSALLAAATYAGTFTSSAKSYNRIIGANDRVRVGVVGFSDRFKDTLFPCFLNHNKELNFDIVGLSDIWNYRRDLGVAYVKEKMGSDIKSCRNNDELYAMKDLDAVIVSTADFQHAMHTIEAVKAGCDAYIEKPFAETMADAKAALKAVLAVSVGFAVLSGFMISQLALPLFKTLAKIVGSCKLTALISYVSPLITLIKFKSSCNCLMLARVSCAKLSTPTTDKSFKRMPILGNERINVKSNSLKSTLAFTFWLITDFTLATI